MKLRTHALLAAALVSAPGWSQDFSLTSTTIAQMWKQDAPGFDKATFTPATQYLGIDVTNLYRDEISLHLFGWGRADLGDASMPNGSKSSGELTYGYVSYRFKEANAEIKAGRFTVNQGVAIEQVDGASFRADLVGGFTVSAFGGRPVLYKVRDYVSNKDYDYQRDVIAGFRVGLRVPKFGEFGVSYLVDGTKPAKDLPIPSATDYTREQVGLDLRIAPVASFDLSGRTVLDVADHTETAATRANKPSKIAEHDYAATFRINGSWALTGAYTQRNYYAFFAGTNLPTLFRQDEKDKFRAFGGSVVYGGGGPVEVVADYRHTTRDAFGDSNRFGATLRWNLEKQKIQTGFSYHRVTTDDATLVDPARPAFGLSHHEARAWAMAERGRLFGSVDAIVQRYDDEKNPYLNGKPNLFETVASLGVSLSKNAKLSGDLSYATNPLFKKDVRGLLRLEYRFVSARKGAGK